MPIAFNCSGCDKSFRVADEMAGRKARCPSCAKVLTVPAKTAVAAAAAKKSAAKPPTKAATARAATPKPPVADYEVVDDDDDEEEEEETPPRRASAKAVTAAPSRRRKDEDEEESPRRRRRPRDEEEEDEDVDEDDEEDEEDEDEDDEDEDEDDRAIVRKKKQAKKLGKKKKRKSSGGLVLLIVGLCAGGVLLLGGGGVLAWVLLSGGSGGVNEALTYAPDNCQTVASIRWEDLEKSNLFQTLKKDNPAMSKGLDQPEVADLLKKGVVQIVFMFGPLGGMAEPDWTMYLKTRQPTTPDEIKRSNKGGTFSESKVGNLTVYEENGASGAAFCQPNSTTVIAGKKQLLKTVLQRNKKPTLSKELEKGIAEASWSKPLAFATTAMTSNLAGLPPDLKAQASSVETVVGFVEVTGDIRASLTALCKDPQSAETIRKKIDEGLAKAKSDLQGAGGGMGPGPKVGPGPGAGAAGPMAEIVDILNSIKISNAGSKVSAEITVKGDTITKSMKSNPFFPGF